MVGSDGGVFSFGSAAFLGSEGGKSIPAHVVGIGGMAIRLAITTTSLPNGASNQAYSTTLSASGGAGSYTWSATGLTSGLSMSTSGVISGTPSSAGTSTVSITVTDSGGASATVSLSLFRRSTSQQRHCQVLLLTRPIARRSAHQEEPVATPGLPQD